MNINKNLSLWAAGAVVALSSQAQTHITFDAEDYGNIGVYDTWVDSPFRQGVLSGNVAGVDNHLLDEEANSSSKILGVQRSRFGSNTFGVKVDLKETFELVPTQRYIHVMIHKPVEGRVMLIGLGKRADRAEQSADVEQFWSYPVNETKVGEWFDAVFPVKGNGGVDIHSLVIVPHCEAPHTLTSDFVAYVDDILLDDNLAPRVGAGDYILNFTAETPHGRPDDRWTSSVGMSGSADGTQTLTIPTSPSKMAYNVLFDTPIKARAGETVTPTFGYTGGWMHTYFYIDRGNDGEFSAAVDDNINLDSSTDLMAFSLFSNGSSTTAKNSAGVTISSANNGFNRSAIPAFTIPSNLSNGFYRVRYKIDWNNIDAGGDVNSFVTNGGIIVDALLNIHGDYCNITNDNRNGEVQTATGETLNGYRAPFGQAFKVKMIPSNGFTYSGIRVRHGYNLTGDSLIHGNPQYRDVTIYADDFDAEDCVVIPAEYMDGDVLIEGLFVEEGKGDGRVKVTYQVMCEGREIASKTIKVNKGAEFPEPAFETEVSTEFYTLEEKPEGTCEADTVVSLKLTNNLPFRVSESFENARWHNLTITSDKNYLTHTSASYISLASSTTAMPDDSDENSQWAFIGDVFNGFMIVNRGAGSDKILSSDHNTSSNTGGSTFPVMTSVPVPSTHNTYWIPTKSTSISGVNGFFLHQAGYSANKMNSRDSKLAYWTGGSGAGSTFIATELSGYSLTIPMVNQGIVEVYDGDTRLSNGSRVDEGTELRIVVTPGEYYMLTALTVNGEPLEAVDGVYTFVVGTEAVVINAVFERDPDAPVEYCMPVYGGSGTSRTTTSRTDRHLDSIVATDGTNTINVETFGSTSGRQVYKDETTKVLVTEPGKTITLTTAGSMWAMHNFIYVDFGNDGFDYGDQVVYSEAALGTFSFTVPSDIVPGTYRVRHMIDWTNNNPCEFAQGQSSDNAESVIDFLLRVEADVVSILVQGEGEVEVWSEGNATDGPSGVRYDDGSVIPSGGIVPHVFVNPSQGYKVESVSYTNGDSDATGCTLENVTFGNYDGWQLASGLDRSTGSIIITVVFVSDSQGLEYIGIDPSDGPVEYFNLQGMKVDGRNLLPGYYIIRQGAKTVKILVR